MISVVIKNIPSSRLMQFFLFLSLTNKTANEIELIIKRVTSSPSAFFDDDNDDELINR